MKSIKEIVRKILHKNDIPTCFAPEKSLRFNHSGHVLACCFNRGNILGTFPEQSIESIWFGHKRKQLNNALKNNDFSLGCQSCKKEIECGNREASGVSQYDYLKNQIAYQDFPTMMDFELGSTCNFECIMCSGEYSSAIRVNREMKKPYFSPYEEHKELFTEQLVPFIPHLKEMRFIGGEPFLMKVNYEIWDKVLEINPTIIINVLTNGSILNKRVESILKKGNFKISISIDSLNKATYETIRKNGNFDQVLEHIDFFHQLMIEKNHTMNFNLCAMRQNWSEIPDYFSYCNTRDIQVVLHTVKFPNHCALWSLPSDELKNIISVFEDISLAGTSSICISNKKTFDSLVIQLIEWYNQAVKAEQKPIVSDIHYLENLLAESFENERIYTNFSQDKDYFYFVQKLIKEFSVDDKKKILSFLNKLDIHMLIDEINLSTEERMFERFKVIADNEN